MLSATGHELPQTNVYSHKSEVLLRSIIGALLTCSDLYPGRHVSDVRRQDGAHARHQMSISGSFTSFPFTPDVHHVITE